MSSEVVLLEQTGPEIEATSEGKSSEKALLRVRIEDIIRSTSNYFKIPRNELLSSHRGRSVVYSRQIAMYLAKTLTTRSLPEIGRRFGGRDHTTVLHSVRKIERLINDGHLPTIEAVAVLRTLLENTNVQKPEPAEKSEQEPLQAATNGTAPIKEQRAVIARREVFKERKYILTPKEIFLYVHEQRFFALLSDTPAGDETSEADDRQLMLFLTEQYTPTKMSAMYDLLGVKYMVGLRDLHVARRRATNDGTFVFQALILEHQLGLREWGTS